MYKIYFDTFKYCFNVNTGVRRERTGTPPWRLGLRTKRFLEKLESETKFWFNWFNSCIDNLLAGLTRSLHKNQVHYSGFIQMQWWACILLMSALFPAEAGCETGEQSWKSMNKTAILNQTNFDCVVMYVLVLKMIPTISPTRMTAVVVTVRHGEINVNYKKFKKSIAKHRAVCCRFGFSAKPIEFIEFVHQHPDFLFFGVNQKYVKYQRSIIELAAT